MCQCLIAMPGAEPPFRPTAEDEPLSIDSANWPSPLTDRFGLSWFAEDQVGCHLTLFSAGMRVMEEVATANVLRRH